MHNIATLSINHKLASIDVREKVAFTESEIKTASKLLCSNENINSCVILSTCNRLEIYIDSAIKNSKEILIKFLSDYHSINENIISQYSNYLNSKQTLEHICKVACGLDSMVLGEPQILGQLKNSYNLAKASKNLNKILDKLFQHSFNTAKKIRTETEIGKNPISIAYCGIKLSEKIFTNIKEQNALLIGAGEMIELSAQYLTQKKIKNLIIANRTKQNAIKITKKYNNAKAIELKQLSEYIHTIDILITSTAAPIAIIGKGLIESAIKKRKHKPMFILDMAIPRDVESEVNELNDVFLYTIDDLNNVITDNIKNREQASNLALEIIKTQNKSFMEYLLNLPNEELIKQYSYNAELIKKELLNNAIKQLQTNKNTVEVLEILADKLTNKLLHNNYINIKKQVEVKKCIGCIPKK